MVHYHDWVYNEPPRHLIKKTPAWLRYLFSTAYQHFGGETLHDITQSFAKWFPWFPSISILLSKPHCLYYQPQLHALLYFFFGKSLKITFHLLFVWSPPKWVTSVSTPSSKWESSQIGTTAFRKGPPSFLTGFNHIYGWLQHGFLAGLEKVALEEVGTLRFPWLGNGKWPLLKLPMDFRPNRAFGGETDRCNLRILRIFLKGWPCWNDSNRFNQPTSTTTPFWHPIFFHQEICYLFSLRKDL